jgi:hypothetical protein
LEWFFARKEAIGSNHAEERGLSADQHLDVGKVSGLAGKSVAREPVLVG